MRVFYQLDNLPAFRRAVLTIGSFDGVHHGHQQLLGRINRLAQQRQGESIVVTFHPHPRQVIYPKDKSLQLLTTIEEKVALFERYGVDNVVVVPFTVGFSQQSADEYIQQFLVNTFQPEAIVIGYDHRFGLNRQGDIHYLRTAGDSNGFEVIEIAPQEVDDIAVSSTKIRNALLTGKVADANRWLNHHYTLMGKVVHGQHLGTRLGFPTANLRPAADTRKLIPGDGVYAVRVHYDEAVFGGMLYIGQRPSIEGKDERVIEVNIFDFDQQLYGEQLTVEFIDFVRGDQQFSGLEALKQQLAQDRETVQRILATTQTPTDIKVSLNTAVVILNFNGVDYLRKYLPTVVDSIQDRQHRVIVADNGSTDDSVKVLRQEFPGVECLELGKNHGFAGGYNQALRRIEAEVYVLLNSDVKVTPGWLETCLQQLEAHPQVAACQPKILAAEQPDHFEYAGGAGGWLDQLGYPFCRGRIFSTTEKDEGQYQQVADIFWASGAAMFVRADLFHAMGGFDAEYFAHAEEIDLCWRLKRAGYRILAVPEAVVYHVGGGTLNYQSPRKTYLNFRNTLATSFKNEPKGKLLWWFPLRLVMDGLAGGLFLAQGKWDHISAIVKAHWHFFPKVGFWRKRRRAFNLLIDTYRIGPEDKGGRYRGSIVWDYYVRRIRSFKALKPKGNG